MGIVKKIKRAIQAYSDPLVVDRPDSRNSDNINKNRFTDPETIITEIARRFDGIADYGNDLVSMLIKFRSSLIAGNGPNISGINDVQKNWIENFEVSTTIDGLGLRDFVQESEIEARAFIYAVKKDGEWKLKHLSWLQKKYTVNTNPDDYTDILNVTYKDGGEQKNIGMDLAQYIKTSGRLSNINNVIPRIGNILNNIDNISKALGDWRNSNYLHGIASEHITTNSWEDAVNVATYITNNKYLPGDTTAFPGDKKFVEPSGQATASIEKEIQINLQIVSGQMGVPIHQMGFVSLFGTRAGAEATSEQMTIGTETERAAWAQGLQKIVHKMMLHDGIDPTGVTVTLPMVTQEQLKNLIDVYMPLFDSSLISKKTIMEKIPGIDPEQELLYLEYEAENKPEITIPNNFLSGDQDEIQDTDSGTEPDTQ